MKNQKLNRLEAFSTQLVIFQLLKKIFVKEVIVEDDCAPDATIEFEKKLTALLEISLRDFKENCDMTITSHDDLVWIYGSYMLVLSADDPFHKLYKKTN